MRNTEPFSRSTLATEEIKKLIDAAVQRGFQAISFTGGEPLLDLPRLVELIRHAGAAGIGYIRTGTNGFIFRNPDKNDFYDRVSRMVEMLADTPLCNFWISLDSSVDEVHEKMRGFPGVVAGIAKALPLFHRAGIYPAVNLGINRNVGGASTRHLKREAFASNDAYLETFNHRYRRAFERFYQKALGLGFTMANTCYPMSIDIPESNRGLSAVYAATTVDDIVRFAPDEKRMLFKALIATITRFRSKLRIFSPLSSLEALVHQYSPKVQKKEAFGCRGGIDFFFVNAADGHVYPCGYRGNEDFGRLEELDLKKLTPPAESDACRQCDWECFRDPSELFGPLLGIFSNPLSLIHRMLKKPSSFGTWAMDLRYYRACGFFNGRKPPDYKKLSRFAALAVRPMGGKGYGLNHCRANQNLSVS